MSRPFATLDVYKALADPVRRELLVALGDGEKSVSDLLEPFDMSMPALSRHLQVLREVNLVTQERRGRQRIYGLNAEPLKEVAEWLSYFEQFWDDKLDNLAVYLQQRSEDAQQGEPASKPNKQPQREEAGQ